MRTRTAAVDLLPAGKASTATRIIYYQPRLRFCPIEETNSKRTLVQYASYYSRFWRINNQLAPFWRRVIETKSRQTLVFDPSGSTSHLRACPVLKRGERCFVGSFSLGHWMVPVAGAFVWQKHDLGTSFFRERYNSYVLRSIAVSPQPGWFE